MILLELAELWVPIPAMPEQGHSGLNLINFSSDRTSFPKWWVAPAH